MSDGVTAITSVGIVGCGTMGAGIAELVASAGVRVRFVERDDRGVQDGIERIRRSLGERVRRGRLEDGEPDQVLAHISGSSDLDDLAPSDLVVEAVPESLALKQDVFRRLDAVVRPEAILATNTSSLPVMDLAVGVSRPNRVVGFHFFNPAPVMELVELVRTVVTDDAVVAAAERFARSLGKTAVVVDDRPGFIANRLLFPYLNQAVRMVESGYASREDVDVAMRLGANLPMGPIELVDLIGIDAFLGIMDAIHDEFDDPRVAPRPILRHLAAAGFTGRKAGRGFYRYLEGNRPAPREERRGASLPDRGAVAGWRGVGVVGTGPMASGIAAEASKAGFDVVLCGRSTQKAERAVARVSISLQHLVDRGGLTPEEMLAALGRIRTTVHLDELFGSDLLVEAVGDDLGTKERVLGEVVPRLGPDAVVATTTSSLPVIACAMASGRPERVVGLHFLTPPTRMRLVEVVTTVRTDPDVVEQARGFVARIGKEGVRCGDRAGFIVNALLFPYLNDAVRMLESHYATAEEIDAVMRLGCGYPMGPFELMDVVGLDVTLAVLERLHAEFREPSHRPAELLRHLVDAGFLGRRTGRGFYVHS